MSTVAAFIYWVIVSLWTIVLVTVAVAFVRKKAALGTTKLLLIVVTIDTVRNIVENVYFGGFFGSQYGLFPPIVAEVLGHPGLLILPKLLNVVAAITVILLLIFRWLPMAQREKARSERAIRETSLALRQEVAEHRRLFESSLDLIVVLDQDRIIRRISRSCEPILGYSPEELLDQYGGNLVAEEDLDPVKTAVAKSMMDEATIQNFDCNFRHREGHTVPVQLSGVWSEREKRLFLIGRDMTSAKRAEQDLTYLAHHDQLTGLPNRGTLARHLASLLGHKHDFPFGVVMLDLDGFKDVNDSLGHRLGDCLLQNVARRLELQCGAGRSVYRLGGDEFVILIERCDLLEAGATAHRILTALSEPFEIEGNRLVVRGSAGLALSDQHVDASDLMANADLALYAAKSEGRSRYCLYSPTMRAAAQARLQLNNELSIAVSNQEFEVHYQPQIDLVDGRIVGAEALLRWRHRERGLLMPGSFIDALTNSPHAVSVGRWILETACSTALAIRQVLPDFRIAVNVFPSQFTDGDLPACVADALDRFGLAPNALELEITENMVLSNESVLSNLQTIRDMGVQIAFDDFGTGYASLSCVATYPINRIKIDRSFIKDIDEGSAPEITAISGSIIAMAQSLRLDITAEGVETKAQEAFLRRRGCSEAQGFRYSRALPRDQLVKFVEEHRAAPKLLTA